ncbi:MAG: hypothetical protein CVU29_00450 [Betaproteobacteria bacterium HGW-Betaproteobacteria-22]|nr:MAG: hypothetical protein CVU29_00450 [Betaproteobacteria bacterium HGW-Betaproteobacteria-22]
MNSNAENRQNTPAYLSKWQSLVESAHSKEDVRDYLDALLTQTDACQGLLDKVMSHFKHVSIHANELQLTFDSPQYSSDIVMRLSSPCMHEVTGYPASFIKLVKAHNGISWKAKSGGYFGFSGFRYDEDDEVVNFCGSGFESEYLEEGDNESFLERLDRKGLTSADVISPIGYGQNWVIWNPVKKNKVKEPEFCFVSHEDCEVVTIKKAQDLYFGAFFLRVIYMSIIDYRSKVLDVVYG